MLFLTRNYNLVLFWRVSTLNLQIFRYEVPVTYLSFENLYLRNDADILYRYRYSVFLYWYHVPVLRNRYFRILLML